MFKLLFMTFVACVVSQTCATGQTTVSSQGYSDNSCATSVGNAIVICLQTTGTTCGTITGLPLVGSATLAGNVATLQGCICASTTACSANTTGAAITINNGQCYLASVLGLGAGSFRATWSGSGTCFHEETTITYKGASMTLPDLEKHTECAIPHIVSAVGSIVTANCGGETKVLRLTSGHLVYTQRGLQPAGDLTKDDVLFSDIAEQHQCQIVIVEKEKTVQKYFGLNCYESQVLASGLKSSTFEKLHSVPSFWMAIMGRVLGIKRASQYGDYIEQLASKMNLV
jgi:hypothetical protein